MKKAYRGTYKFVTVFVLIVITLWGCKDDINKTGYDLLLPGDLVYARKDSIDKSTIKSYTVTEEKVRTSKPEYNVLGTFNDSVFGKTTADFACQFRLNEVVDLTGAKIDSLTLTLLYIESYGDTITPQTLKVYELNADLDADATYLQDHDLKDMAKSEVLAETHYIPKSFKLFYDSIKTTPTPGSSLTTPLDTVLHKIVFNLDLAWAEKLKAINLQGLKFPNDTFIKYFKGLYVEAGSLDQGGNIMRVRTLAGGSELSLYYHNATDTTSINYKMKTTSARTSRYDHVYSTTSFFANLDKLDQQDTLIYLQTTGGLSSKIYIPSLSNWKDSSDYAINKAELIFSVEKSFIDTLLLPAPDKLFLSLIAKDESGTEVLLDTLGHYIYPSDLSFSEAYYGGFYNPSDGTYRFNLAKYVQDIIKGKKENDGFYLTTADKNSIYRRVALKGATSKTGIRFLITYSKIK